jgi:hypothetical protein
MTVNEKRTKIKLPHAFATCDPVWSAQSAGIVGEIWKIAILLFSAEPKSAFRHFGVATFNPCGLGPRSKKSPAMKTRRRSEPHTFGERLAAEKIRLEAELADTPHGPVRDALVKKLRQVDTASHMAEWLSSSELKPPE